MTIENVERVVSGRPIKAPDENSSTSVMISVPISLKVALEKYAKEHDTTVGAFGRQALADAVMFDMSGILLRTKKGKGQVDPVKAKEEARIRGKEQRAMLKLMLQRVRAEEGLLEDEDEDEDDEVTDEDEEEEPTTETAPTA